MFTWLVYLFIYFNLNPGAANLVFFVYNADGPKQEAIQFLHKKQIKYVYVNGFVPDVPLQDCKWRGQTIDYWAGDINQSHI